MTLQFPAIDTRSDIRWMSPATGLWVASRHGEHAGMVERVDGTYEARSARHRALGSFEDLDAARAAVDSTVDEPTGAPRGARAAVWSFLAGTAAAAFALALAFLK